MFDRCHEPRGESGLEQAACLKAALPPRLVRRVQLHAVESAIL